MTRRRRATSSGSKIAAKTSSHSANDWVTLTGGTGSESACRAEDSTTPAAGAGHLAQEGQVGPDKAQFGRVGDGDAGGGGVQHPAAGASPRPASGRRRPRWSARPPRNGPGPSRPAAHPSPGHQGATTWATAEASAGASATWAIKWAWSPFDLGRQGQGRAGRQRQGGSHDAGEQLARQRGSEQLGGPASFGVTGPRQGRPEAVLPLGQDRVAAGPDEHDLGRRLGGRSDVTVERGQRRRVDAVEGGREGAPAATWKRSCTTQGCNCVWLSSRKIDGSWLADSES